MPMLRRIKTRVSSCDTIRKTDRGRERSDENTRYFGVENMILKTRQAMFRWTHGEDEWRK